MMSYKVNGVEYDSWSAKNQRIIDELVNREVYCCMTTEMEYMLSKKTFDFDDDNPFDDDDIMALDVHHCPKCGDDECFETVLIDDLSKEELHTEENTYICPECGLEYTEFEEAQECCGRDVEVHRCSCGTILNEDEYQDTLSSAEVYEWWAVSKWFGEKLKEQGCVVIDSWGKSYWGRCTTGQSISLDGCVVNIAKKMKILDGMENEWSV